MIRSRGGLKRSGTRISDQHSGVSSPRTSRSPATLSQRLSGISSKPFNSLVSPDTPPTCWIWRAVV